MILGDGGTGPTLDDLFRRAGVRRPHALALVDPPDRARFTTGAPRALTFSQADRAISAFAARLRGLGLHADTVVGLQLPNTVESAIALLGALRAGMIAAPLPLLWRQRDLVEALGRTGAKAIVTAERIGGERHSELAMQVAAELFPIRCVCAFGANGADGIVPLDDIFDGAGEPAPSAHRDRPGAHVAVLTFETRGDGIRPVARSHAQLVAFGAKLVAECGLADDGKLIGAISLTSFAALSAVLLPWLIGGGTLHLHHGFAAEGFAAQCAALDGGAVVLPGAALAALGGSLATAGTVIALWRAPERMNGAPAQTSGVVDVACFGEIGLVAGRRDAEGGIQPLPLGDARRTKHGTLALQISGMQVDVFPPGEASPADDDAGFIDTGFPCRVDAERGTLTITGGPPGLARVGGYRFQRNELDRVIAEASPEAMIVALPDALLGERLAGSAPDPGGIEAVLRQRGLNPLIASAFRPWGIGAGRAGF